MKTECVTGLIPRLLIGNFHPATTTTISIISSIVALLQKAGSLLSHLFHNALGEIHFGLFGTAQGRILTRLCRNRGAVQSVAGMFGVGLVFATQNVTRCGL